VPCRLLLADGSLSRTRRCRVLRELQHIPRRPRTTCNLTRTGFSQFQPMAILMQTVRNTLNVLQVHESTNSRRSPRRSLQNGTTTIDRGKITDFSTRSLSSVTVARSLLQVRLRILCLLCLPRLSGLLALHSMLTPQNLYNANNIYFLLQHRQVRPWRNSRTRTCLGFAATIPWGQSAWMEGRTRTMESMRARVSATVFWLAVDAILIWRRLPSCWKPRCTQVPRRSMSKTC